MHFIGKIDKNIYACVTEDITTDEVIITDERIGHIEDHHPGEYENIAPFLGEAVRSPDYILRDKANTGLILKMVEENGKRIQLVLRLHTSGDKPGYKNSIISAWRISKTRWESYVRNKHILYKRNTD
ncbi:PBECR2 nuclease fold domain-containing protein [Selenomonas sp. ND2010]|uniref:PBECR2 nuclease fold domain-containing protein n=1 Tax=Selenomonas sp. ND2010 TaxID=1410618 RepID=UPI00051B9E76|nr:PBECR2 nuclease fold domain-containing protein [Selenomonas sp. ND2010]